MKKHLYCTKIIYRRCCQNIIWRHNWHYCRNQHAKGNERRPRRDIHSWTTCNKFMDIAETFSVLQGPYTILAEIPTTRKDGHMYICLFSAVCFFYTDEPFVCVGRPKPCWHMQAGFEALPHKWCCQKLQLVWIEEEEIIWKAEFSSCCAEWVVSVIKIIAWLILKDQISWLISSLNDERH